MVITSASSRSESSSVSEYILGAGPFRSDEDDDDDREDEDDDDLQQILLYQRTESKVTKSIHVYIKVR